MKKLLLAAMIAVFGLLGVLGAASPGHHYHHYGPKPKADMYAPADMYSSPLDMY
jgi:hypothetical protein